MKGVIHNGNYTKHEDEKDILRLGGGSWTINMDWITEGVHSVTYITPTNKYSIQMKDAIQHGFLRVFKGEKKLVVPLKHWDVVGSRKLTQNLTTGQLERKKDRLEDLNDKLRTLERETKANWNNYLKLREIRLAVKSNNEYNKKGVLAKYGVDN